jgi:hypothetical protein
VPRTALNGPRIVEDSRTRSEALAIGVALGIHSAPSIQESTNEATNDESVLFSILRNGLVIGWWTPLSVDYGCESVGRVQEEHAFAILRVVLLEDTRALGPRDLEGFRNILVLRHLKRRHWRHRLVRRKEQSAWSRLACSVDATVRLGHVASRVETVGCGG